MTASPKLKVSITLSRDLLERIDREAQRSAPTTRSAVIEAWLRSASRSVASEALARETAAYYQALTAEERAEDADWAATGARALSQRANDQPPPRRRRRR